MERLRRLEIICESLAEYDTPEFRRESEELFASFWEKETRRGNGEYFYHVEPAYRAIAHLFHHDGILAWVFLCFVQPNLFLSLS